MVVVEAPPAAAVVGVVVGTVVAALLGTPLTLGRVPTSTRTATATTKTTRTTAARTTESEADMPVCGCSSSIGGPACPAPRPCKPFRWSGRGTEVDGPVVWVAAPE